MNYGKRFAVGTLGVFAVISAIAVAISVLQDFPAKIRLVAANDYEPRLIAHVVAYFLPAVLFLMAVFFLTRWVGRSLTRIESAPSEPANVTSAKAP